MNGRGIMTLSTSQAKIVAFFVFDFFSVFTFGEASGMLEVSE